MKKKRSHAGSNASIIFLSVVIIYLDFLLSSNILFLLVPFFMVGLMDVLCKKCRSWTFRVNSLFIWLLILLGYDYMIAFRQTYPVIGH